MAHVSGFDWDAARARLERAAVAPGMAIPEAEAQRILEERARRLARPRDEVDSPGEFLELLVFQRGEESFAVDADRVVEVVRRAVPTPLPGRRSFLPGVIHHRGRVLGVIDVRELLIGGSPAAAEGYAVVVNAGALTFAVFANEVDGLARVAATALAPVDGAGTAKPAPWIRGTTGEMVVVIDVDGLARDTRVVVNEPGA